MNLRRNDMFLVIRPSDVGVIVRFCRGAGEASTSAWPRQWACRLPGRIHRPQGMGEAQHRLDTAEIVEYCLSCDIEDQN